LFVAFPAVKDVEIYVILFLLVILVAMKTVFYPARSAPPASASGTQSQASQRPDFPIDQQLYTSNYL
jgi:hypothetical protein